MRVADGLDRDGVKELATEILQRVVDPRWRLDLEGKAVEGADAAADVVAGGLRKRLRECAAPLDVLYVVLEGECR